MTPQVIAFYVLGGALTLIGIGLGCLEGFKSTEWWMIAVGVILAVVGLLVQLGILNPPVKEK